MKWNRLTRKTHYWASLLVLLPLLVIIATGLLLQLKKQSDWVQPPTMRGAEPKLTIDFDRILTAAASNTEAGIRTWDDVDRLDVRPSRGVVKVRGKNHWEVQVDTTTGEVLQVAYRRSDLIESIHDGSFFHEAAKLWVFLPAGAILLLMWFTGVYLFILPIWKKRKSRRRART